VSKTVNTKEYEFENVGGSTNHLIWPR